MLRQELNYLMMPKNPQNYIPMNLQKTNGGILENWIMHQIEYSRKSIAIYDKNS